MRAGAVLQQELGTLEGLPRIGDRSLRLVQVGLLQFLIKGEQGRADLDRVAFAHRQRFDAAGFIAG